MKMNKLFPLLIITGLILSACSSTPGSTAAVTAPPDGLTPYATVTNTPTITPTPKNAPTATLAPTATPTPRIYTVKEKDTLGVIAYLNGITVEELKAANPTVDPYMMPVGTKLIIPLPQANALTPPAVEPTLVPVLVNTTECSPAATGGLYCFAQVTNSQETPVDSFSAEFQLTDSSSGNVAAQQALLPLSVLGSGETLPLFAYFPPPVAAQYQIELKVLASASIATPAPAGFKMQTPQIQISADGYSAEVTGEGVYTEAAEGAKTLIITAVSFDDQGRVNGIRQTQMTIDTSTGSSASYSLNVYSSRGTIATVSVYAETQP